MNTRRFFGGLVLLSMHCTILASETVTPGFKLNPASPGEFLQLASNGEDANRLWERMSREEREAIRAQRQQYESLPPTEQEKIKRIHDRYQQLAPEERRELQEKWRQQQRGEPARGDRRNRGKD